MNISFRMEPVLNLSPLDLRRGIAEHLGYFVAYSKAELLGMIGADCVVLCLPDGTPTNHFVIPDMLEFHDDMEAELWGAYAVPNWPEDTGAVLSLLLELLDRLNEKRKAWYLEFGHGKVYFHSFGRCESEDYYSEDRTAFGLSQIALAVLQNLEDELRED